MRGPLSAATCFSVIAMGLLSLLVFLVSANGLQGATLLGAAGLLALRSLVRDVRSDLLDADPWSDDRPRRPR